MMSHFCKYRSPTQSPNPTTVPPPANTDTDTVLSIRAIIGIGVAGGMLLGCLVLCFCVCVCCLCLRARRKKEFNPSVSEKQPAQGGSPAYRTLTPPKVNSDLDRKEVSIISDHLLEVCDYSRTLLRSSRCRSTSLTRLTFMWS